jgi:hypothetical protein
MAEEPQTRAAPRFQFGISTMLWITTATAVLCAVLFPMPAIIAIPLMLEIGE